MTRQLSGITWRNPEGARRRQSMSKRKFSQMSDTPSPATARSSAKQPSMSASRRTSGAEQNVSGAATGVDAAGNGKRNTSVAHSDLDPNVVDGTTPADSDAAAAEVRLKRSFSDHSAKPTIGLILCSTPCPMRHASDARCFNWNVMMRVRVASTTGSGVLSASQ